MFVQKHKFFEHISFNDDESCSYAPEVYPADDHKTIEMLPHDIPRHSMFPLNTQEQNNQETKESSPQSNGRICTSFPRKSDDFTSPSASI